MARSGIDNLASVLQGRMQSVVQHGGKTIEFGTIDSSTSALTLNSTGSEMVVPHGGYLTMSDLASSGRKLIAWVGNTPVIVEGGSAGGVSLTAAEQAALTQAINDIKV